MKNWSVTAATGGRYPGIDPVFFGDRSRVALATALAIKIYQLGTKQMITKISLDCTEAVQIMLSTSEHDIFVLKRSGVIEKIGIQDSSSEKLEVDSSIKVKRLLKQVADLQFIALVSNSRGLFDIGQIDLEAGTFSSWFTEAAAPETHSDSGIWAVSPSQKYVSFITPKTSRIELIHLETPGSAVICSHSAFQRNINSSDIRARSTPTSLAVSNRGLVAVGTSTGVIDVFYPGNNMRTLKWHLEPVRALQFVPNDEYLLSGGHERVLVFWQLDTNKQQFLPRLDGAITSISMNSANTLYGLTLSESQLVVLSAVDLVSRLHVSGTKASFTKLPPDHQVARRRRRKRGLDLWTQADYTTPLAVLPGSRHVYLLAESCQAQVYSLVRDDQDCVISLAKTLSTGKVRQELEIADPKVEWLSFTTDGRAMVTCDLMQSPPGLLSSSDQEVNLKFWQFNDSTGSWTLATRIVNPHGPGVEIREDVSTGDTVVTVGSDGSLRAWKSKASDDGITWSLRHILPGFAAKTRHVSLALSRDRSVLSLGHENAIYLIDFQRFKVIRQLPNLSGSPIRALAFAGQHLIVLAKSRLVTFDIVSLTQSWSIELKTNVNGGRLLAVDPTTGNFALAVNHWTMQYRVHSRVLLFDPKAGPIPQESYSHPYAVGSLALIPGTNSFCFIDQRGVLNTLAGPSSIPGNTTATAEEILHSSLVSLKQTQALEEQQMDVDSNGSTKNIDVNSVLHLFESNVDLDQLFDKVLTLVS